MRNFRNVKRVLLSLTQSFIIPFFFYPEVLLFCILREEGSFTDYCESDNFLWEPSSTADLACPRVDFGRTA